MTIQIRTKVATLLGYENIQREGTKLTGWRNGYREELPKYECSLDAIYRAFEEMRIDFKLIGVYSALNQKCGYVAGNLRDINERFSDHPAKAMCCLLINTLEGTDVPKP